MKRSRPLKRQNDINTEQIIKQWQAAFSPNQSLKVSDIQHFKEFTLAGNACMLIHR